MGVSEEEAMGGGRDESRGEEKGVGIGRGCPALLFPWDWSALAFPGAVAAVTPDWPPYYSLDTC